MGGGVVLGGGGGLGDVVGRRGAFVGGGMALQLREGVWVVR